MGRRKKDDFSASEPVVEPDRPAAGSSRVPEQAWEAMLDQMVEAAFFFDMSARMVTNNRAAQALVPLLKPGTNWGDFDEYRGLFRPRGHRVPTDEMPLMRALRGERVMMEEYWAVTAGEPLKALSISASPIYVGGRQVGVLIVTHDVTKYRAVEDALRASEARLRCVVEHAPAIISVMDADYRLRFVSRTFNGQPPEAYLGQRGLDFTPEASQARARAVCEEVMRTGRPIRFEIQAGEAGQAMGWYDVTMAPIQEAGMPKGVISLGVDISDRKQAEAERDEQKRLLEQAERLAAMGSWCFELGTGKVRWSDGLYRILGYEPGEVVPGPEAFRTRMRPEDRAKFEHDYPALVAGEIPLAWEFQVVRPGGEVRMVRVNGTLERDEQGRPAKVIGIMYDITEQFEMERMKNEFIATVSHELRTPLTAVRAPLTMLRSGWRGLPPEDTDELLEIAVDGVDRMVRLVNDVLDIQRLATGRLSISTEPTDTRDLVERAVRALAPRAEGARVGLRVRASAHRLTTDGARVVQVLSNLLDNAVSFAPAGTAVEVRARRQGPFVRFDVADRGPGIPAEQLETVFERFRQLDQGTKRRKGGTGLGLAISREIVGLLGGRIWAERRRGGGTTFSFVLPV